MSQNDENKVHYERVPLKAADFTVPRDIVEALGNGDPVIGHAGLSDTFGTHVMAGPPGVVPSYAVAVLGHGDPQAGRKVLSKFVAMARRQRK
jgi:hypothetical protein